MVRRNFGVAGAHDWSSAVATDTAGDFFVAGQTGGSLFSPFSGTGHDIWVVKLDGKRGDVLWGYQVNGILVQHLSWEIYIYIVLY